MTDFKATSEQWADAGAFASATRACILELRARVEALEAQAGNLKGSLTSSTPPPVATDEDLWKLWAEFGFAAFRAIYNLGTEHGQARNYPAISDISTPPTIIEQAEWLREQGWKEAAALIELEAGR